MTHIDEHPSSAALGHGREDETPTRIHEYYVERLRVYRNDGPVSSSQALSDLLRAVSPGICSHFKGDGEYAVYPPEFIDDEPVVNYYALYTGLSGSGKPVTYGQKFTRPLLKTWGNDQSGFLEPVNEEGYESGSARFKRVVLCSIQRLDRIREDRRPRAA